MAGAQRWELGDSMSKFPELYEAYGWPDPPQSLPKWNICFGFTGIMYVKCTCHIHVKEEATN